ncbi:MAG: response regulator [Deltaproteobacteria bacterium]|nr:response regulator [Deltaproteobacteria bacterium]
MHNGLDIIIVDDEPGICEVVSEIVNKFYIWGDVITFMDVDEAIEYCLNRAIGIAVFVVDVFLGGESGFSFLDAIGEKFISAHNDTIVITGKASDDIVNMCLASNISYLLEKPINRYSLQLSVQAITMKYLKFAQKLLKDPVFVRSVAVL